VFPNFNARLSILIAIVLICSFSSITFRHTYHNSIPQWIGRASKSAFTMTTFVKRIFCSTSIFNTIDRRRTSVVAVVGAMNTRRLDKTFLRHKSYRQVVSVWHICVVEQHQEMLTVDASRVSPYKIATMVTKRYPLFEALLKACELKGCKQNSNEDTGSTSEHWSGHDTNLPLEVFRRRLPVSFISRRRGLTASVNRKKRARLQRRKHPRHFRKIFAPRRKLFRKMWRWAKAGRKKVIAVKAAI